MIEVVAALIWQDNRFLICQRPKNKARALLWEFVGGKVEKGEGKEQALVRECKEELNVVISVGDVFMEVTHEYPDVTVRLTLFNARILQGEPEKLEHNDMRWITTSEIKNYEFCPADKDILDKLIRGESKMPKTILYDKLVRDKIPSIIQASGKTCETEILSQDDYLKMLDKKLDEELAEYRKDGSLEELADLLEVLLSLVEARGYSIKQLYQVCDEKRNTRGGFKEKILLKSVEERE